MACAPQHQQLPLLPTQPLTPPPLQWQHQRQQQQHARPQGVRPRQWHRGRCRQLGHHQRPRLLHQQRPWPVWRCAPRRQRQLGQPRAAGCAHPRAQAQTLARPQQRWCGGCCCGCCCGCRLQRVRLACHLPPLHPAAAAAAPLAAAQCPAQPVPRAVSCRRHPPQLQAMLHQQTRAVPAPPAAHTPLLWACWLLALVLELVLQQQAEGCGPSARLTPCTRPQAAALQHPTPHCSTLRVAARPVHAAAAAAAPAAGPCCQWLARMRRLRCV
jgi:hypothetical protein